MSRTVDVIDILDDTVGLISSHLLVLKLDHLIVRTDNLIALVDAGLK